MLLKKNNDFNLKYSIYSMLFSIYFFTLFMKLEPLLFGSFWGSDYGEYYSLTSYLTTNHHLLLNNYLGWGFGYPYFPGMFAIASGYSLISGMSVFNSINYIIPAIVSLSIFSTYLLTERLVHSSTAGIFASLFMAVIMPEVFITSHPIPASIGDFLFITSLLLFIKVDDDPRYWLFLMITSMAMIPTHHLSSYMFLISGAGALLVNEILTTQNKPFKWAKLGFLELYVFALYLYWYFYAYPFYREVVGGSFAQKIPVHVLFLIAGVSLLFIPLLIHIRRKLNIKMKLHELTKSKLIVRTSIMFVVILGGELFFVYNYVPGTTMTISYNMIIYFMPLIVLLSFVLVGSRIMDFFSNGNYAMGFVIAIGLSAILGAITHSIALIPYRHVEYMLYPLAIFFGSTVWLIFILFKDKWKTIIAVLIALILISNAVIAYPPQSKMLGFNESYSTGDFIALSWMQYNIHNSSISSDHRMSSAIWGFTHNYATWGNPEELFFSNTTNVTQILKMLSSVPSPYNKKTIEYVVIDAYMINGMDISPYSPAYSLSNQNMMKFYGSPFIEVYSCNGVYVYMVNWQYNN